jgi:hypothetical protein
MIGKLLQFTEKHLLGFIFSICAAGKQTARYIVSSVAI